MVVILKHKYDGDLVERTVEEILEMINDDRSEQWTNYTEDDWQEGLVEWTDYRLANELEKLYGGY